MVCDARTIAVPGLQATVERRHGPAWVFDAPTLKSIAADAFLARSGRRPQSPE